MAVTQLVEDDPPPNPEGKHLNSGTHDISQDRQFAGGSGNGSAVSSGEGGCMAQQLDRFKAPPAPVPLDTTSSLADNLTPDLHILQIQTTKRSNRENGNAPADSGIRELKDGHEMWVDTAHGPLDH